MLKADDIKFSNADIQTSSNHWVKLYRAASLGPTVKKSPSDAKCQDIIKLLMLFRLTARPENLISLSLPSKS